MRQINEKTRMCIPCMQRMEKMKGGRRVHQDQISKAGKTRVVLAWCVAGLVGIGIAAFASIYAMQKRKHQAPPPPSTPPPAAVEPEKPAPPRVVAPRPVATPRPRPVAPQVVTFSLQGDALFEFGKSTLQHSAESSLAKVADAIAQHPAKVVIHGYTDSIGTLQANTTLSTQRAESVKAWLVETRKISPDAITVEGLGPKDPVAPNTNADGSDNPEGRAKNRRVTVTVTGTQIEGQ